jgi:hypothetical protein
MFGSRDDRLDLDQLRRQAKELRDSARLGAATQRIARYAPAGKRNVVTLAVAQLVIARERGFCELAEVEGRGRVASRGRAAGGGVRGCVCRGTNTPRAADI